jgi:pimeloyl-ACP methyl ester carboxylesterase
MDTPGQAQVQHKSPIALAIHGAGAGGWEFNLWRRRFMAAGWVFHAPDLRALDPLQRTTLADYRAQVAQCCASLAPDLLIGASLGGLLALLAGPVPRRILINPLPALPWVAQLPPQKWPATIQWAHRHDLASTRRALGRVDSASAAFANQRWRDESGAVLSDALGGVALDQQPSRMLVIAGAQDCDIPAAVSQCMARDLGADYLEWPDAGHVDVLFGSAAQPLLDHVLDWLGDCRSPHS